MGKKLFGAVSLAMLLAVGVPAVQAAPPTVFTFPDNYILFDTCSGEAVQFTGTTTLSLAFETNNNTSHAVIHEKQRDDGIGLTSGVSYNVNSEVNVQDSFNSGQLEFELTMNSLVIGAKAVANESIKQTLHITIDANGTLAVFRSDLTLSCRG